MPSNENPRELVKPRPQSSVSERELILWMADNGRRVNLAALANWRKNGLLPPFSSRGLGQAKGKTYYWTDCDIKERACAVHDVQNSHSKLPTLVALWLLGFSVPLAQLRRIWASTPFCRQTWHVADGPIRESPGGQPDLSDIEQVLHSTLVLSDTLSNTDKSEVAAVFRLMGPPDHVHTRRNCGPQLPSEVDWARFASLVTYSGSILENSDLLSSASDGQLRAAQTRWHELLEHVHRRLKKTDRESVAGSNDLMRRLWIAERIGPPVFLITLLLVRRGMCGLLERALEMLAPINTEQWLAPSARVRRSSRVA